jgi:hypothetical protein
MYTPHRWFSKSKNRVKEPTQTGSSFMRIVNFLIYFISKPKTRGYFDYTNTKEPESHKPITYTKLRPRIDRLVSKHLSSHRMCIHSPVTFSPGSAKGLGNPSHGAPMSISKPPFGFETSGLG